MTDLRPVYWDASAVLSVLFKDVFTDDAQMWAQEKGVHFMPSLTYSETCAVIARMQREGILSDIQIKASFEALENGLCEE